MVELVDCALPYFTTSVVLPVPPVAEDSPPAEAEATVFFHVIYTCHGETFTSPDFSDVESALEWAEDELFSFGSWSLDGNTLTLSDAVCNGVLGYGTGIKIIWGCTILGATNYNIPPGANANDGSCVFPSDPTPNYIDVICSTFTVVSDIQYAGAGYPDLVMDSYVETCNPANVTRPVVLVLHGGGGTKTSSGIVKYCEEFASRGWKAFSVEYGNFGGGGGGFTPTEQIQAVQNTSACIRHIYANDGFYGINALNIYVIGVSAGAVTSAQTLVGSRILDLSNPASPYYNPADPEYTTYFDGAINSENAGFPSVPTSASGQSVAVNGQIDNFITPATHTIHFYNGDLDCTVIYSEQQCGIPGALENFNKMIGLGIASTFTPIHNHAHGITSFRDEILEGGLPQVIGLADPDYFDNSFSVDIGMIAKFAALLQP